MNRFLLNLLRTASFIAFCWSSNRLFNLSRNEMFRGGCKIFSDTNRVRKPNPPISDCQKHRHAFGTKSFPFPARRGDNFPANKKNSIETREQTSHCLEYLWVVYFIRKQVRSVPATIVAFALNSRDACCARKLGIEREKKNTFYLLPFAFHSPQCVLRHHCDRLSVRAPAISHIP